MTVEDYLLEIQKCEDSIYTYQCQIRELNGKIEGLQLVAKKFSEVGVAIQSAAENSKSSFGVMVDSFVAMGKKISNLFFERNVDVYVGTEYQKACASAQNAVDSAYKKIDEFNEQIDGMYTRIYNLNQQIENCRCAISVLQVNDGGRTDE